MTRPDLSHIPAPPAWPLLGHTLPFLSDPNGLVRRAGAELGPVFRLDVLGRWRVALDTAEAVDHVLKDPDRLFSSKLGGDVLHPIFTGGLAARDFDDHRHHRRIMQSAFRAPAMRGYNRAMVAAAGPMIERLPGDRVFPFATEIKKGLLQMGGQVFLGLDVDGPELAALNRDFILAVGGCLGLVRKPVPGTRMWRGLRARDRFADKLRGLIPERRATGGEDFFSQMCVASSEDGAGWTDAEIIQHFAFLLLAGHDTTASGLTTIAWGIGGAAPDWQDRLVAEVDAVGPEIEEAARSGDLVAMQAALDRMTETERVFDEALRCHPPVPFLSRFATRDTGWQGTAIPAGTTVMVPLASTMQNEAAFPDPGRFDPGRFSDRGRPAAFVAFGGGPHKCIGLRFAYAQTKIVVAALLSRYRVEVINPEAAWDVLPITRPRDGLPVRLVRR